MNIYDEFGRVVGRKQKTANGELLFDSSGRLQGGTAEFGTFNSNMRQVSQQKDTGFLFNKLNRSKR